jgi:hypothetical protein
MSSTSDFPEPPPPICPVCKNPMTRWKSVWAVSAEMAGPAPVPTTYWVWTCPRLCCHAMHLEQS